VLQDGFERFSIQLCIKTTLKTLAVSLPNASGPPATDLIDDVVWTLNRAQPVSQPVPEGRDEAPLWHI